MPAFLGLAVQSDVRCASGATVTFFRPEDLLACTAVLSPTEPESLSVTISRSDARAAECTPGRVLRTCFVGGAADREWDIAAVQDGAQSDELVITAQPIALRLARALYSGTNAATGAAEFSFSEASRSITALVDALVIPACDAAGLTWVERGTIDSTALVDLAGEWASALEIVQALAGEGRANGEWQLSRNGDTDYRLDILNSIGASAPTARVRTALNLLENRRTRELYEAATRLYPRGSSEGNERTIADHLWRVKTVVDAAWLELEDISGGAGPLAYDDQLNGLYLAVLNSHTFSSQIVADSVAATQRVQVASTAGITAGEWCRFLKGSGANGARVTSLHRPTAALAPASGGLGDRAMVLDRPALRGDCNLVPNPWMRDYASLTDAPDLWTDTAGTPANYTVARELTLVRDGTPYSCRFTTTGDTTLSLETPDIRPWAIAGRRHFAAIWFNVQAVPAAPESCVILELITSGGTLIQEIGRWVRGNDPLLDTWIRLISDTVLDLSAITTAVRLRARVTRTNAAAAQSGWDIVFGPALLAESEVPVTDIEYSGGTKLWQSANRALAQVSSAIRGYDLRLLDLERDDAVTYADFALAPGGSVEVTDSDLGETVSLRLFEYRPNYLDPLESTIRIGVPAVRLSDDGVEDPTAPTLPGPSQLVVRETTSESGTTGTVQLAVTDPQRVVQAVQFRTVSARGDWTAWGAMTNAGAGIYSGTVSLVEKVPARINWRVLGVNPAGESGQVLAEGVVPFTMGPVPQQPVVEAVVRQDGTVDVAVIGDSDTASLQIGFSTVSQAAANAALGSTQNARQHRFQSVGSLTLGQKAYLAVKAWSGTGATGSGSITAEAEVTRFNVSGSKTIRLPAQGSLVPFDASFTSTQFNGYFSTPAARGWHCYLPVPKGATLTAVRVRVRGYSSPAGKNSGWDTYLDRVEQSGSRTQIGTASTAVHGGTWETVAISSLSESTSGDRSYRYGITSFKQTVVFPDPPPADPEVAWIEYDLDYPDVTINT